jgi:aldose 1-epimerase
MALKILFTAASLILLTLGSAWAMGKRAEMKEPAVTKKPFGTLPDGRVADLYTLKNGKGARVTITNYGGIVVSLEAPDKTGKLADVVLGFDTLADYVKSSPYFGATIGRYGNRIAKGKFKLGAKTYTLAKNNGPNALHGGLKGFDKVLWTASPRQTEEGPGLFLQYLSPDGEEGYPGALNVDVLYVWTNEGELKIDFRAVTTKTTVVNLTHHSYFNLAGQGNGDILGHEVTLFAERFTPVDAGLIPTGELKNVKGTPFDFREPHAVGERIAQKDLQLERGKGYDHNWVLSKVAGQLSLAARVREPRSGRVMEVETTDPGIQFYTGNFLDGTLHGKGGAVYQQRSGLCLEPQHFPDSPNHPRFPSTVLKPGETYHHSIVYRFGVEK